MLRVFCEKLFAACSRLLAFPRKIFATGRKRKRRVGVSALRLGIFYGFRRLPPLGGGVGRPGSCVQPAYTALYRLIPPCTGLYRLSVGTGKANVPGSEFGAWNYESEMLALARRTSCENDRD